MELVKLFLSILSIVFAGWGLLSIIESGRKIFSLLEKIFISYGLGAGFISLEMLAFYLLNISFSIIKIMALPAVLFAISAVLYLTNRPKVFRACPKRRDTAQPGNVWLRTLLASGIAFEIVYAAFRALVKPIESYDAIAIYAIKAKMFFMAKGLTGDFFGRLVKLFPHPDYPLNIPLLESYIYLFLGNLNDQLVKVIFPLYFAGILAIFYYSLRRLAGINYALLFTFILATIPQFNAYAANAYLEIPLAYYYFASAIFLFNWFGDRKDYGSLGLSAVMAGLAGWTKNEGLMYCAINSFVLAFFIVFNRAPGKKKDAAAGFAYIFIVLLILYPWAALKRRYGISNDEIALSNLNPAYLAGQLRKILPIMYEFQKQFFGPKKWNILWPVVSIIIISHWRAAVSGMGKYIAISLCLAVAGYVLFYMISYVDVAFFLAKTWSRFLLHFLPLALYWAAHTMKGEIRI